eukprot:TRINITY_DN95170_c0_g1_i1.p1 TRINITY_DN95170_c0_g1~~TRINITY_DN95170_c0_g1_i1.p1  ORF type:complete len:194 (+),score=40.14 TRINITY_DN95170_c0_g1_i1:57-584(+)
MPCATRRASRLIASLCCLAVCTAFVSTSTSESRLRCQGSAPRVDFSPLVVSSDDTESRVCCPICATTAALLAMILGLLAGLAPAQAFLGLGEEKATPLVENLSLQNVEGAENLAVANRNQLNKELQADLAARQNALPKEERVRRSLDQLKRLKIDNMDNGDFALRANLGPPLQRA